MLDLYRMRKERNLTLRELEAITGISKTQLNSIENNRTSPTLYTMEQIAKGLNITPQEFIKYIEI